MIFFFAYNWADLPLPVKFATLGGGAGLAAIAAMLARLDTVFGQALLISASVLIGIWLAVIGQVYQTGADSYELFAAWALLILPWVVVSRSAGHWLIWLVLVGLAAWLYGSDILLPARGLSWDRLTAAVALIPALGLAARDAALSQGVPWLGAAWERLVLLGAALSIAITPALGFVLGIEAAGPVGLVAFAAIAGAALLSYARLLPDRHGVALCVVAIALIVAAAGGRVLDEAIGFTRGSMMQTVASLALLMPWLLLVFAAAALAVSWIRKRIAALQAG